MVLHEMCGRLLMSHETQRPKSIHRIGEIMTGVSAINKCPICNGPMETYLETKTSEFDGVCRGACGYSSFAEIESDSVTGLKFWVETQFFPMSKDGTMVARPGGQHKWNNNEFPSADPTRLEFGPT
jgi:hypothetical protein